MGIQPELGQLYRSPLKTSVPTYLGWVTGDPKYLTR